MRWLIAILTGATFALIDESVVAQGGNCKTVHFGEVVCGGPSSAGFPLAKRSPEECGPIACRACHGDCNNCVTAMWPLNNSNLTWPLDPNVVTGTFQCLMEGYTGPTARSIGAPPGPPVPLTFADEGAVVYTNPTDPNADSTRNNTYVDPASGTMRFRLPLNLAFKGRNTTITLDLLFNSSRNRPEGILGNFWAGSWEDKIYADAIVDRGPGGCPDPKPNPSTYELMNSLTRLMEHHGDSTSVWTNVDAIEMKHNFFGVLNFGIPNAQIHLDGLPSGNLLGGGKIKPPNNGSRTTYELIQSSEYSNPASTTKVRTDHLGPSFIGNLTPSPDNDAHDFVEFVPALGDDRRMNHRCGGTEIRYPDGRIDRFSELHSIGEDFVSGPGLQSMANPFRVVFASHRIETVYPNGDRVKYTYDEHGRGGAIVDEFGREIALFIYDQNYNRLMGINDISGRVVSFTYDSNDLLSSVTLARTGQTWQFQYVVQNVTPPAFELRNVIKQQLIRGILSFSMFAPTDAVNPVVTAGFTDLHPCPGANHQYVCTQLTLGGGSRGFDINGDGTPDTSFTTNMTAYYAYGFNNTDELGDYTTTVTDSLNHTRTHVFDWQSREKSRTETVTYPGSSPRTFTTTFGYSGFHPKVIQTGLPRGNTTVEHFQFEDDDANGVSYYWDGPRDRFAQQNLLWRQKFDISGMYPLTETWTYEPLFQQMWTYQDPRNYVTSSVYDYQEGPTSAVHDLCEGWHLNEAALVPSAMNLGDVNGDGITTQQLGRRIQAKKPRVEATSLTTVKYNGPQDSISSFAYNSAGQLISETDPAGYVRTYAYYSGTNPNEGALSSGPGGYLGLVVEDANGAHLIAGFGYDSLGRRIWSTTPRGYSTVRSYNDSNRVVEELAGNVSTIGTPYGSDYTQTQYDYDLNDNVVEKRSLINTSITPELNFSGKNPGWVTTRYGYDPLDQTRATSAETYNPLTGSSPSWLTTYFHYDGRGKTTKEVSPAGRAIGYSYDSLGRVKSKRRYATVDSNPSSSIPPSQTGDDGVIDFDQDNNGNLVSAVVYGANTTTHSYVLGYDDYDRRATLTDPEGTLTTQEFDAASNIVHVTVDGQRVANDSGTGLLRDVQYVYDERNQLAETVSQFFVWAHHEGQSLHREDEPGGHASGVAYHDFAYDPRGLLTYEKDDLGREQETDYDGIGRAVFRFSPLVYGFTNRNYVQSSYDGDDNLVQTTEHSFGKNGSTEQEDLLTVTWTYDGLERKTQEQRPSSVISTYVWSSLGDLVKTTNPNGIGTRCQFDTLHRDVIREFGWDSSFTTGQIVDSTYNADGLIRTERDFDADGKVVAQRDDKGNATTWQYDWIGRTTLTAQADLSKESVTYNPDGTIATEGKTFRQSGADVPFSSVSYQYDLAMRKTRADFTLNTSVSGLSGVYLETLDYDGLGRVVHSDTQAYVPNSTDILKTDVDKEYDTFDHVWCDDQTYTIDHPSSPDFVNTSCVESEYDSVGNRIHVSTAGYDRYYLYNDCNQIMQITDQTNAVLHSFRWIGAGNRLNTQLNLNNTSVNVGFSGWDAQHRLFEVDHKLLNGSTFAGFQYYYDSVGNELDEVKTQQPGSSKRMTYDGGNRLTNYDIGNYATNLWTEQQKFNLDGVGNWRKHKVSGTTYANSVDVVQQYTSSFDSSSTNYDARGNLTAFGNKALTYDVRGRIVACSVAGGPRQDYAYDAEGRRLAAEGWVSVYEGLREIQQIQISNTSSTRFYTYGVGLDDLLLYESGATRYYVHQNRNGSTIALTKTNGSVAETYDYTPFGVVSITDTDGGGLIKCPYEFGGRRWDSVSGLYYMRARYYLPEMGRFTSRDPIGFWGDVGSCGNPFAYCGDNPFSGYDPFGSDNWFSRTYNNGCQAIANWLVSNNYDDEFKSISGGFVGAVDSATFGAATLGAEALTGDSMDRIKNDPKSGYNTGYEIESTVEVIAGAPGMLKAGGKLLGKAGLAALGREAGAIEKFGANALRDRKLVAKTAEGVKEAVQCENEAAKVGKAAENEAKAPQAAVTPGGEGSQASNVRGGAPGTRPGQDFTKAGKDEVWKQNAADHEGKNVCEDCGSEVVKPEKHTKGKTPPSNEGHVDHIDAKSNGGSGTPDNGQILCRDCNLTKGNNEP